MESELNMRIKMPNCITNHCRNISCLIHLILVLWAGHTLALDTWKRGRRRSRPLSHVITTGSVLGSSMNLVANFLSPDRAVITRDSSRGWGPAFLGSTGRCGQWRPGWLGTPRSPGEPRQIVLKSIKKYQKVPKSAKKYKKYQ